jgi:hypothetical protein
MRWTIRSVVVSVSLVPLLVSELPLLLGLVFAQFRAIPVPVSLVLLMVAQAIPFGSFVLPLGIFTTPVACLTPGWTVGPVPIGVSRAIIHRRGHIITRAVTAKLDRKTSLSER